MASPTLPIRWTTGLGRYTDGGRTPADSAIKVKRSLSDRNRSNIGVTKDPGYNSITIVDSLNLLNQSSDKLCNSFNVDVTYGAFSSFIC